MLVAVEAAISRKFTRLRPSKATVHPLSASADNTDAAPNPTHLLLALSGCLGLSGLPRDELRDLLCVART